LFSVFQRILQPAGSIDFGPVPHCFQVKVLMQLPTWYEQFQVCSTYTGCTRYVQTCYARSSELTKLHTSLAILTIEKESLLQILARPDFIMGCHRSFKFHQVSGILSVSQALATRMQVAITCSCTQHPLNPCITDYNISLESLLDSGYM
jgi:hypothetical protein